MYTHWAVDLIEVKSCVVLLRAIISIIILIIVIVLLLLSSSVEFCCCNSLILWLVLIRFLSLRYFDQSTRRNGQFNFPRQTIAYYAGKAKA